jgi:hypothetical protein
LVFSYFISFYIQFGIATEIDELLLLRFDFFDEVLFNIDLNSPSLINSEPMNFSSGVVKQHVGKTPSYLVYKLRPREYPSS